MEDNATPVKQHIYPDFLKKVTQKMKPETRHELYNRTLRALHAAILQECLYRYLSLLILYHHVLKVMRHVLEKKYISTFNKDCLTTNKTFRISIRLL